jgi:hypothetical protein
MVRKITIEPVITISEKKKQKFSTVYDDDMGFFVKKKRLKKTGTAEILYMEDDPNKWFSVKS